MNLMNALINRQSAITTREQDLEDVVVFNKRTAFVSYYKVDPEDPKGIRRIKAEEGQHTSAETQFNYTVQFANGVKVRVLVRQDNVEGEPQFVTGATAHMLCTEGEIADKDYGYTDRAGEFHVITPKGQHFINVTKLTFFENRIYSTKN